METVEPRERSIDYLGVVLFSIATVALLILLTETSAPLGLSSALGHRPRASRKASAP